MNVLATLNGRNNYERKITEQCYCININHQHTWIRYTCVLATGNERDLIISETKQFLISKYLAM